MEKCAFTKRPLYRPFGVKGLIITTNTTLVIVVFAQGNLVVVVKKELPSSQGHWAVQVSSFCLYLDMTVMMLWVLSVPKSGFQIWTGSDIQ